jgi:hypothetical protein
MTDNLPRLEQEGVSASLSGPPCRGSVIQGFPRRNGGGITPGCDLSSRCDGSKPLLVTSSGSSPDRSLLRADALPQGGPARGNLSPRCDKGGEPLLTASSSTGFDRSSRCDKLLSRRGQHISARGERNEPWLLLPMQPILKGWQSRWTVSSRGPSQSSDSTDFCLEVDNISQPGVSVANPWLLQPMQSILKGWQSRWTVSTRGPSQSSVSTDFCPEVDNISQPGVSVANRWLLPPMKSILKGWQSRWTVSLRGVSNFVPNHQAPAFYV